MRSRAAGLLARCLAQAGSRGGSGSSSPAALATSRAAFATSTSGSAGVGVGGASRATTALAAAAAAAATTAAAAWTLWSLPAPPLTASADPLSRLARDVEQRLSGLTAEEVATVRLFEENAPSVVAVTNLKSFRFFRLAVEDIPVGAGSGFVWDSKGRVVTNYHVVQGATHVAVTLLDGTELRAEVIGTDPEKDIAVLQLLPPGVAVGATAPAAAANGGGNSNNKKKNGNNSDAPVAAATAAAKSLAAPQTATSLPPLTPVTLGCSSKLLVGQRVYAIGAPLGLDHTFSTGIVSAVGRQIPGGGGGRASADSSVPPITNVIQTDASGVNPGSSGGPLLDSRGRTVGVLCAIADPSGRGSNAGIAFAIPIDAVAGVVKQIIEHGRVLRPSLGVAVAPGAFAQRITGGDVEGVLLLQVPEGSPAADAGLRGCAPPAGGRSGGAGGGSVGDIVVSLDGKQTPDVAELMAALDGCAVGQTVDVGLARYYAPPAAAAAGAGGGASGAAAGGGLAPGGEWRWETAKVKLGERTGMVE
jgi:S1-C subfamily serine protease